MVTPSSQALQAGHPLLFSVYVVDRGGPGGPDRELPSHLTCRLTGNTGEHVLSASATHPAEKPPGVEIADGWYELDDNQGLTLFLALDRETLRLIYSENPRRFLGLQ